MRFFGEHHAFLYSTRSASCGNRTRACRVPWARVTPASARAGAVYMTLANNGDRAGKSHERSPKQPRRMSSLGMQANKPGRMGTIERK
jgi:hypothetical protein